MKGAVLSVQQLTDAVIDTVTGEVAALRERGPLPTLRGLRIGDSPVADLIGAQQAALAKRCGLTFQITSLSSEVSAIDVDGCISDLSRDPAVGGVTFLPDWPEGLCTRRAMRRLDPAKDVDGAHPQNMARALCDPDQALLPPRCGAVLAALTSLEIDLYEKTVGLIGPLEGFGIQLAGMLAGKHCRLWLDEAIGRVHAGLEACDLVITGGLEPGSLDVGAVKGEAILIDCSPSAAKSGALGGGIFTKAALTASAGYIPAGGLQPLEKAMWIHNALECLRLARPAGGAKSGPAIPKISDDLRR